MSSSTLVAHIVCQQLAEERLCFWAISDSVNAVILNDVCEVATLEEDCLLQLFLVFEKSLSIASVLRILNDDLSDTNCSPLLSDGILEAYTDGVALSLRIICGEWFFFE